MSKNDLFQALDGLQDRKQDQRKIVPAVLGQGDANKTVDVLGQSGMTWVRLYGDRNQAQPAVNYLTAHVHGLPVYVAISTDMRTGRRSYEVVKLGDRNILTSCGAKAFDPYLPEHHKTHEWSPISHGRDVVHVYPRALAFGLVYPTIPASMRCKVSPIGYGHVLSPKVYLGGETKDFTADVPSTANKAVLVQISMKGSTNTLHYDKGAEFSWTGYTDPVPASAVPSLTAGCLPLDRIILFNGMTSITEANFLHDFRLPFQTIGGISEATELLSDAMSRGYVLASDGAGGCVWVRAVVVSNEPPAETFPGQLWIDTSGINILSTEDGSPLLTEDGGPIAVEGAGGLGEIQIWARNVTDDGWDKLEIGGGGGASHDPVTLTEGCAEELTLNGQELNLDLSGLAGGHDAVTLAASASELLDISDQELSLNTKTANYVLAGPTSGAATAPTFRALVAADLPAASTISCCVYNDANISISNGSDTALTFNSERWDTDGMHSTSTNTSRITIKTAGYYYVWAGFAFAPNTSNQRSLSIVVNGSTAIARDVTNPISGGWWTYLQASRVYYFNVNDYVEVLAWQSSGGSLNVLTLANFSPEFVVHKV